jgi:tripartite-type tricarboxylate transporter receptor subunit TctC
MDKMSALLKCLGAAVAALALAGPSFAQDSYPNRPIRIIVPFPAGGGNDITARLLGDELRKALGQPVVVENQPGASTMIGTRAAARAAPDGYTLLVTDGAMAIHPLLYKSMDYDWEKDLAPISLLVKVPNVLTVHSELPIRNVQELVAYAKSHPLAYSSSGSGNANHLSGELFNKMAGVQISHIPYKGVAPQLADVAAGHVAMTFASIGASQPFIRSGKARPIAVSSSVRVSTMPEVPTVGEYPPLAGFDISNYFGFFAPANLPAPIMKKLSAAVMKSFASAEIVAQLQKMGFEPAPNTPEQFRAFIKAEAKKYERIVIDAKVKLDN